MPDAVQTPDGESEYAEVMAQLMAPDVTIPKGARMARRIRSLVPLVEEPTGLAKMYPVPDTEDEIAQRPPLNDFPLAEELVLEVRNSLGFKKEKWDAAKLRALTELGRIPWKLTGIRALSLIMFESIERLQLTMEAGQNIATSSDPRIPVELKLTAGSMMAACGKSLKDLAAQTLITLERGIDTDAVEKAKAVKPKNRPPQFGNLIKVESGGMVSVSALPSSPSAREAENAQNDATIGVKAAEPK